MLRHFVSIVQPSRVPLRQMWHHCQSQESMYYLSTYIILQNNYNDYEEQDINMHLHLALESSTRRIATLNPIHRTVHIHLRKFPPCWRAKVPYSKDDIHIKVKDVCEYETCLSLNCLYIAKAFR